jgi:peptide deformylase
MNLKIFPSSSLSAISSNITDFQDAVPEFMDADFLRIAYHGAGLAANQVGLLENWWVMPYGDGESVAIINPTVEGIGKKVEVLEGCLSLPGHNAKVWRHPEARVVGVRMFLDRPLVEAGGAYVNLHDAKEFTVFDEVWTGFEAQLAQHEFDHLNGKLYTSLLSGAERSRIHGEVRKAKIQGKV